MRVKIASAPTLGPKQVVARHRFEAAVDFALFARQHFVHRRPHVVIDAPLRHAAKGSKRTRVGVKQHFVPLAGVGYEFSQPAHIEGLLSRLSPKASYVQAGQLGRL